MDDIKNVIAKNLIQLRKKHNMTQNELAVKLNYSDNAISRWEHAEVTPSIETLQQIAQVFNVPTRALIEDDATKASDISNKKTLLNNLATVLISASFIWFIATIIFVCGQLIWGITIWQVFCWCLPIISLVMFRFQKYWPTHIYKFVVITIFLWTFLGSLFLQFYEISNWWWLIFTPGVPIQIGLAIWAFVKPKPTKKKKANKKDKTDKN